MRAGRDLFLGQSDQLPGIPDFINHLEELAGAAPITYVTSNFPPAFIMVSSNDASQLGLHDFPQMLAKLNSVGITGIHAELSGNKSL